MILIKLKAIQDLRRQQKNREEERGEETLRRKHYRDLFIRVARHVLKIAGKCPVKIKVLQSFEEEYNEEKETMTGGFLFEENSESRLYRKFLNKWEDVWSAAEFDEEEETCLAEMHRKERRRSSKHMYKKSKQYISPNLIKDNT